MCDCGGEARVVNEGVVCERGRGSKVRCDEDVSVIVFVVVSR